MFRRLFKKKMKTTSRRPVIMSDDKKLVEMLVKSAGGWASLLYKTLQQIADEHKNTEAIEIIELYATYHKIVTVPDTPIVPRTAEVAAIPPITHYSPLTPAPGNTEAPVPPPSRVAVSESQVPVPVVTSPIPPEKRKVSRPISVQIHVDGDIGSADGSIGLESGTLIPDLSRVVISTPNGATNPGHDGLVTGSSLVSGKIRTNGQYRLVFKDGSTVATITCLIEES